MDDNLNESEDEKVVKVEAPKTSGSARSLAGALALVAFVIALLAFGVGFAAGKITLTASSAQTPKTSSPSAKIAGGGVFVDEENLYAVSYPNKWEAKGHAESDYSGVRIDSKKGYVDLWLLVDQPFFLGEKHQKVIESEGEIVVTIDEREVKGSQFNYKAGNFFIVLILADTANSPQVTIWIEADDEEIREEALSIVQSFEFLNK